MEGGMNLEELGERGETALSAEPQRRGHALGRDPGDPHPLLARDLARHVDAPALGDRHHERAHQQVALEAEFLRHPHQSRMAEVFELETGIEGPGIVGEPARLRVRRQRGDAEPRQA